jgi:hypothetical protein
MSRPVAPSSRLFRAHLTSRILAVVSASSLGVAYAACGGGGSGTVTGSASSGAGPGAGGAPGPSSSSIGGAVGTGGLGGGSSSDGLIFDANIGDQSLGPPPNGPACFDWSLDAGPCPTDPSVVVFVLDEKGCMEGGAATQEANGIVSTLDGGVSEAGTPQCCYEVSFLYCINGGRPYVAAGGVQRAPVVHREGLARVAGDWADDLSPCVDALSPDERSALATAWGSDGRDEHASMASFSRFSLELLACGAPAELVALAHRAALDEGRHARLCFGLASAYAGHAIEPGAFPIAGHVDLSTTLAELAASTVREACAGETISASVAAEQLARATDPAVREALAVLVQDEARHAELAWRTVAWAVATGGVEVRRAVEHAFLKVLRADPELGEGLAFEAHGRLDRATLVAVARAALAEVVLPGAVALLGRAPSSSPSPACKAKEQITA